LFGVGCVAMTTMSMSDAFRAFVVAPPTSRCSALRAVSPTSSYLDSLPTTDGGDLGRPEAAEKLIREKEEDAMAMRVVQAQRFIAEEEERLKEEKRITEDPEEQKKAEEARIVEEGKKAEEAEVETNQSVIDDAYTFVRGILDKEEAELKETRTFRPWKPHLTGERPKPRSLPEAHYWKEKAYEWAMNTIPEEQITAINAKYAAIQDEKERNTEILYDLGMAVCNPDENDPDYDNSYDEEWAPGQVFINFDPYYHSDE